MNYGEILDAVERFASRPIDGRHYPTIAECEKYEQKLLADNNLSVEGLNNQKEYNQAIHTTPCVRCGGDHTAMFCDVDA